MPASSARASTRRTFRILWALPASLSNMAGEEDDVIAAMLHDAVEDCGGLPMLEKIRATFGDTVASTVEQC